jgi:hypothetical protein
MKEIEKPTEGHIGNIEKVSLAWEIVKRVPDWCA